MESLKLCLKAAHATQNKCLLIRICAEIVEFLDHIENRSQRKLLANQLCPMSVLLTSIQGITSDMELLLHILKLLCYISESENFVEYFWSVLGTIARTLVFVINSHEYGKLQEEFVEIIFMVDVLMRRFCGIMNQESINEDNVRCLRSLVILAGTIFHSPITASAVRILVVLLFNRIVSIVLDFRHAIAKSDDKLLCVALEKLYGMIEFCFEYQNSSISHPILFIALKMLLSLASFQDLHQFDQACLHKFVTVVIENHMWEILFVSQKLSIATHKIYLLSLLQEDVGDLIIAEFLITSINSILWLIRFGERNTLRKIMKKFVKFNGIERLIIFSSGTRCDHILTTKIKLLIGTALSLTIIQTEQNAFEFVKSILHENMEIFSKLNKLNSVEIYKNAKSFICIFYVIVKFSKDNSLDLFSAVLEKLHSVIHMKKINNVRMTSDEFRMCLSIFQVCQSQIKQNAHERDVMESIFAEIDELLRNVFEEQFCMSSVRLESEEFKWIKRYNQNFFRNCVEYNLDQRNYPTSKYILNSLAELIQADQISHFVFSKSYNQIINSSKILASITLTSDDLNNLLQLYATCEEIHSTNYLGLFFILHQHVDYLEDIDKVLTVCRLFMKKKDRTSSIFGIELKIVMFDLISKIIVRKSDLINVNFFRRD